MMKIISRTDAVRIAPDYVNFIEGNFKSLFDSVLPAFEKLKRGATVITFVDSHYEVVRITSMRSDDPRAIDGPIVRVGNGTHTWRVDGDKYAYPIF